MDRDFLDILGCPICFGPLVWEPSSTRPGEGSLECPSDNLRFPVEDGIPRLVRPEREHAVEAYAAAYGRVWQAEGWGSADPNYLLHLPYRDVTGRQSSKWRVKARSLEALLRVLDAFDATSALDLGAGTGWLSYRLAGRGYQMHAIDVLVDPLLGLRAARAYLEAGAAIHRAQGEMERLPLRSESLDLVIANASLHYASPLSDVLSEVRRVLRRGRWFVVMNSPVHADPRSASRAQADFQARLESRGAPPEVTHRYHHFVRADLQRALEEAVGPVREAPFEPGFRFRLVRRAKGVLLGMELASFPLLVVHRT